MTDDNIKTIFHAMLEGDCSAIADLNQALKDATPEERDRINQAIRDMDKAHAAGVLAKDRTYPMTYAALNDEQLALSTVRATTWNEVYRQETAKIGAEADLKSRVEACAAADKAADKAVRDLDLLNPFLRQAEWRTTPMYKGWDLELVEATYGETIAITRSRYGYRVMTTPHMQSLDVDFSMAYCLDAQRKQAFEDLSAWIDKHPGQVWKVYDTAKGLRFIRIDSPAEPDEEYVGMAESITNADRLYARLCLEQRAYRIRISAKPWRISSTYPGWSPYHGHFSRPDWSYDFDLAEENARYDKLAARYRVARLAPDWKTNEVSSVPQELKEALLLHDKLTGATSCVAETTGLVDEEWGGDREIKDGEISDLICHDAAVPILVAFNHVYRGAGMCPPLIWQFISRSLALRAIEGERVEQFAREEWDSQRHLCQKWCGTQIPTFDAAVKYWEGQQVASGDFRDADCSTLSFFSDAHVHVKREQKAMEPSHNTVPTDEEDYFARLAASASEYSQQQPLN